MAENVKLCLGCVVSSLFLCKDGQDCGGRMFVQDGQICWEKLNCCVFGMCSVFRFCARMDKPRGENVDLCSGCAVSLFLCKDGQTHGGE